MGRHERWTRGGRHNPRPRWWTLYAIGAVMVAVIGLVELLVHAEGPRKVLETLTVIAGFGLTRIWVRLNRVARELEPEGRRA